MIARLGAVAATTAALLALAPPAFGGFTAQMTDLGHVAFSGGGNRMADVSTARDTGGGGGLPNNYWTVEPFPSGLPGDALDYDPCHASDNGQFLWCDTDKTPVPTVTSVTGTANRDDFRVGSAYDPIDITGPVDMGAGDDQVTLFGPGARALVQGGAGTGDTLNMYGGYLGTINQRWRVDLAAGTATSTSGPGSSFTFSGFETVNGFTSPYSGPGFEELGDDGDNRLFGTNQVDTLIGRGGVDQIVAKAGDDVVTGGEGADTIDCGDGDDTVTDATVEDTINANCEHRGSTAKVTLTLPGAATDRIQVGDEFDVKVDVAGTGSDLHDVAFTTAIVLASPADRLVEVSGNSAPAPFSLGASETKSFTVRLKAVKAGTVQFTSSVTGKDPSNNPATGTDTGQRQIGRDLEVKVTADPAELVLDQDPDTGKAAPKPVTVTVDVTNTSGEALKEATLNLTTSVPSTVARDPRDPWPLQLQTKPDGGTLTESQAKDVTVGALAADQKKTLTFKAAATTNAQVQIDASALAKTISDRTLLEVDRTGVRIGGSSLDVELGPGAIGTNDVFELKVELRNIGSQPLRSITLPSGTGIIELPGADNPLLRSILGPLPPYPTLIGPGQSAVSTIPFWVFTPGTARLQVLASGIDDTDAKQEDVASVVLEVTHKPLSPLDARSILAGGAEMLLDQVARERRDLMSKLLKGINAKLDKAGAPKATRTVSKAEAAFAEKRDLNPKDLKILGYQLSPKAPGYGELFYDYLQHSDEAMNRTFKKGVEGTKDFVVTPFEYYRDWAFEPAPGARSKMFWELADASLEAGSATLKGAGWLTQTAIEMQTEQMKLMFGTSTIEDWQRRYDQIVAAGEGAERLVDAALEAKTNWAKLVKNNPRKAVEKIAEVEGVVEGELLTMAMQEIIGGGLVKGTQMLSNARKAGKVRAGLTEGAETAEALAGTGAKTLATADEAAKAIPGLGNLSEKQISYFKSVLKRLSEKYGIEIELQARPVNEFSTRIAGGIGKVEAVPTKNITLEDTMMGAPEKWLGQTAYYKPKLPKNLGELGAAQQEKFKLRYDEKLKEYLQFIGEKADPSGKAAKVEKMLKPGGAEVSLGKNYKAQIELAKTVDKDSGAILIQYKKLEVNGQKIFTGKPRPIISDIDFNAVVNAATGRALPAGIRGQVELELMNDFSKAAKDGLFPFGFHGWTHSGFDLIAAAGQAPSSLETFSFVSKYMLMYATKEQAAAFAAKWAPKLGTTPEKLLEGFTTGKHLVKITKDKAVLGPGANPVLGIGTP